MQSEEKSLPFTQQNPNEKKFIPLEHGDSKLLENKETLRQICQLLGYESSQPSINVAAVVKIFCTRQNPNYAIPWQTSDILAGTGSGAVIEGNLILTAAHVIANHTYIQIQKSNNPNKCSAKLVNICHDCDLAIITPEEPDFLDGITPLKIGSLPSLRDRVLVCGFPIGGEELSITEGVVSRVEIQPYSHSKRLMLAAQVDAAINSGNSGGPVLSKDGTLIGIAFQALEGAENMGYMVPPPIITHFLEGTKRDGPNYKGFPDLGVLVQPLPNPMMRQYLQMKKEQTGVLVTKVFHRNSAWGVLKEKDVILEIDGYPVANNGTVRFFKEYRTDATVIVHQHFVGEQLSLKVLREGKELSLTITLLPSVELVPLRMKGDHFLRNWFCSQNFQAKAPSEMIRLLYHGKNYLDKIREVIVLTMVLVDHLNVGYDEVVGEIITHVNEQPVLDLVDLVEKIESVSKPPDEGEEDQQEEIQLQTEGKEETNNNSSNNNNNEIQVEAEEDKKQFSVGTEKEVEVTDINNVMKSTENQPSSFNHHPSFSLYWNFQKPLPKRLIQLITSKNYMIILPPPYREEAKKAQEKMLLRYKVKKDRQLNPDLKIHDAL